jgi:hypothetical protein
MHQALRSWRDDLPCSLLALCRIFIAASHVSQSPKVMGAITPVHQPQWINVGRPSAFTLESAGKAARAAARCAKGQRKATSWISKVFHEIACAPQQ